ncbi:hypothetical protein GCM10023175_65410 [Pseudonocardia xishanensis]|uniref:Uncharacterized protein n=1 Tax=Pseudonocardia xishanensis TaxID=630995 RepID=A0ABP8S213_9PSEU
MISAHTGRAREILALAVNPAAEQTILDRDSETARFIGRPVVAESYPWLADYRNTLQAQLQR